VRLRELEVDVSRVAGVREVTGLALFRREQSDGSTAWRAISSEGGEASQSLELAAWQLPELLAVVVADDPQGAPAGLGALPNAYADPNAVAVPVVPKVC